MPRASPSAHATSEWHATDPNWCLVERQHFAQVQGGQSFDAAERPGANARASISVEILGAGRTSTPRSRAPRIRARATGGQIDLRHAGQLRRGIRGKLYPCWWRIAGDVDAMHVTRPWLSGTKASLVRYFGNG
jgi:hypothetical protein